MRIDPIALRGIAPSPERPTARAPAKPSDPAAVVALGEAATAATQAAAGPDPGITTRLASIRQLLADGEYVVDLDRLSERILDDDLARSGQ